MSASFKHVGFKLVYTTLETEPTIGKMVEACPISNMMTKAKDKFDLFQSDGHQHEPTHLHSSVGMDLLMFTKKLNMIRTSAGGLPDSWCSGAVLAFEKDFLKNTAVQLLDHRDSCEQGENMHVRLISRELDWTSFMPATRLPSKH